MPLAVRRLSRLGGHLHGSKALKDGQKLAGFIASQKARYLDDVRSSKGKEWAVVMGNEAAGACQDLDSVACSIAYAWLRSEVHHKPTVPYIQCERDDYGLRPENIYALRLAGIEDSSSQLLCATDLAPFKPFPSSAFILVDHNRLSAAFSQDNPSAHVVSIVDHHEDEGQHTDADPRIVAPSGSCSAHVANLLPENIPSELATLLLSAILIDTSGLQPGGKATDVDRVAAAKLLPHSSLADSSQSLVGPGLHEMPRVAELAEALQTRKADVSTLSAWDLLRRDYKEYTYTPPWLADRKALRIGLATVPLSLKAWARGGVLESEGVRYMDVRGLAVLGVLTTFRSKKGKHKRQMAWIIRSPSHASPAVDVDSVATRLWEGVETSDLEAKPLKKFEPHRREETGKLHIRVYKQGNAKATRKAVAPLIKRIMESS
ncbi:hypothetical protein HDZ31DRAFT_30035 [Schizophyllum fasciatum]